MEDLPWTGGGDLLVSLVAGVTSVVTVARQHKHHLRTHKLCSRKEKSPFHSELACGFVCIQTNLRLFLLNELENFMGQPVVFWTGVREDVDEGAWQGDLQGDLNGADAHLRTVAAPLWYKERSKCSFESSLSYCLHSFTVGCDHFKQGGVFGHPFFFHPHLLNNVEPPPAAFRHTHSHLFV